MSFARRPITVACVALSALVIAACGGGGHHHAQGTAAAITPAPTPTPSTSATTSAAPVVPAVNPLTGLGKPSTNPVVAVKIDDTGNGRPQRNIDQADIVYIEQVEGGLTRLLAIFDSTLPVVEAVRSTRASDPELVEQYGPVAYVASGGASNPLAVLDHSDLRSSINDRSGPGFNRDFNRSAPYNLLANLAVAGKALKGPPAKSIGLVWSAAATLTGDPVALSVRTTVGSTAVRFDWSAALKRYQRVIGGVVQHTAAGKVIDTPNVIVQFCSVTPYPQDTDVNHNPSKYTHTIGSGKVVIFRDGRRIDGTWSRASAKSPTIYKTAAGAPIALQPGGAWVVLAANGVALTS